MIRRFVPVLAAVTVATAFAAQAGSPLSAWAQKVNGLKSLQADVVVSQPNAPSQTYKIAFAKPSSFKVDDAKETIVADGKTITVFDKGENYFYTRPQTDAELKALVKPDQYALFRAFFDAKAFDGVKSRAGASKSLGGETVTPIEFAPEAGSPKTITVYVGPDGLARKGESALPTQQGKISSVLTAKNVVIDGEMTEEAFAFKAPDGAQEIQYADLQAAKWFTDLDEAKVIAAKSGRKIFIDFAAEWCGPCKMLEREVFTTEEFKALSKKYVFLRIDTDLQPTVAASYKIEAMPTQIVAKADGSEIGRTVGYGGAAAFFEFINRF